jgi:protein TonB
MITVKFWHIALSFIIAQMLHVGVFVAVSQGQEPQVLIAGSSVISAHFDAGGTAAVTSMAANAHAKNKAAEPIEAETLTPTSTPDAPHPEEVPPSPEDPIHEPKPEPLPPETLAPEPKEIVQATEPAPAPQEMQKKLKHHPQKHHYQKKAETPKPETPKLTKAAQPQKKPETPKADQVSAKDQTDAKDRDTKSGKSDENNDQNKPVDAASPSNASLAGGSVASQAHSSATPGNAASTNYAGKVMKHLSKFRRPRASSPGSALITFTFTATGEIETIEVSKSSGSYKFDKDAIKFIKRAAPFPSPPDEATKTFTVEIEGR